MKFYIKEGRRYKEIDAPRPLEKLRYQQYRNQIVDRLPWGGTTHSLNELVKDVLNLLEEIVNEKGKN